VPVRNMMGTAMPAAKPRHGRGHASAKRRPSAAAMQKHRQGRVPTPIDPVEDGGLAGEAGWADGDGGADRGIPEALRCRGRPTPTGTGVYLPSAHGTSGRVSGSGG
jgi:hypothetical protein